MSAEGGLAPPRERVRRQAPLWFGLLGGPAGWALHLGLSYYLVPTACATTELWLHAVTVVSLAVGAGALWSATRTRSAGRGDASPISERNRFLGVCGMTISALFVAVILMEGLQPFLVDPCL